MRAPVMLKITSVDTNSENFLQKDPIIALNGLLASPTLVEAVCQYPSILFDTLPLLKKLENSPRFDLIRDHEKNIERRSISVVPPYRVMVEIISSSHKITDIQQINLIFEILPESDLGEEGVLGVHDLSQLVDLIQQLDEYLDKK
jgi:hypothetical protein